MRGAAPKVLVLTGGGRDVFGGGAGTYVGSLLSLLGATNVLGAVADGGPIPGFGVIDVSSAAALNPDAVLLLPSADRAASRSKSRPIRRGRTSRR